MVQIIPAILATSEEQYQEDLEKIESAPGLVEGWLHIDLADNKFVQNKTIDLSTLEKYPSKMLTEVHLMVEDPDSWVESLSKLGIKRIIAHIECGEDTVDSFLSEGKASEIEVGLAIKLDTPLESLEPYWPDLDMVLVMSIIPGFQGQPFEKKALDRVKEIFDLRKASGYTFLIGVDGHVNAEDAKVIIESGADILVSGSYLLKGNIDENLEEIWEALQ